MMNAPVCTTLIAWSRMEMNWSSSGIRMDEYLLAERTAACIDSSTAWLSTSPDCCSWSICSISASSISGSNCTLEVEGNSGSGSTICSTSFTSFNFASSLTATSFGSLELFWNQILRPLWILFPRRMINKSGVFFSKNQLMRNVLNRDQDSCINHVAIQESTYSTTCSADASTLPPLPSNVPLHSALLTVLFIPELVKDEPNDGFWFCWSSSAIWAAIRQVRWTSWQGQVEKLRINR